MIDQPPEDATHPEAITASFRTTHWSAVLRAGDETSPRAAESLDYLCRVYWYPLYAFARRSNANLSVEDVQDATQSFFAHFLSKSLLDHADPQRGRFRSFLLTAFRNFLVKAWRHAQAEKRGGGREPVYLDALTAEGRYQHEPADLRTPEQLFERRWAVTLLETVLGKLQAEYARMGKAAQFEQLKPFLTGEGAAYSELSVRLGLSEPTARVVVYRLRQRYRDLFRGEIAQTVENEEELREEIRHICRVLCD